MLQAFLSGFAIITTVALFLTGVKDIEKFKKAKSTGNASIVPFASGIVNCALWLRYGQLTNDTTQIIVNGSGLILYLYYTRMFYIITESKDRTHRPLQLAIGYIVVSIVLAKIFATTTAEEILITGYVGALTSIGFFASPLVLVSKVIESRSCDGMSFPLSVLGFLVSISWVAYGYVAADVFIYGPNGLGALLCTVQLLLFYMYPAPPAATASQQMLGIKTLAAIKEETV